MSFIKDELNKVFKKKDNQLVILIFINVAIFILFNIVSNIVGRAVLNKWFALIPDLTIWITHFWTNLTYMFVHFDLLHLLFNMLWLYWMGKLFDQQLGGKRLTGLYLLGGLAGGVLFVLSYLLLEMGPVPLVGASAGVMAIVVAVAVLTPNQRVNMIFLGQVPLKYLAIGIFVLFTVLDIRENLGGKIAHLGGALMGYFYVVQFRRGKDYAGNFYSIIFNFGSGLFKRRKKMKVEHRKAVDDDGYNLNKKRKQEKIDSILDKISKSGYESLSADEKRILFDESNKN